MIKPGGKDGGEGLFLGGLALMIAGLYFFLDSVKVSSGQFGAISGMIGRGRQGMETTSMGIVFVPFLIGVGVLFYDSAKRWAWWLSGLGLVLIVIEMMSRIRFVMEIKTSTLLLMFILIAAGAGLVARALILNRKAERDSKLENKE